MGWLPGVLGRDECGLPLDVSVSDALSHLFPASGGGKRRRVSLGWEPFAHQRDLYRLLEVKHNAVVCFHRRAGKSEGLLMWLVEQAWSWDRVVVERERPFSPPQYAYILPDMMQAFDVLNDKLEKLHIRIPGVRLVRQRGVNLLFPNGAKIMVRGSLRPDSIRGTYYDAVVLDEYSDMSPSLIPYVIRPALADYRGRLVISGTVKGRNDFYRKFAAAESGASGDSWGAIMRRASETTRFSPEELSEARAEAEATDNLHAYLQEMECDWDAALPGSIWGKMVRALRERGDVTRVPHDPERKVIATWDIGVTDDTAVWFFQLTSGGGVRVIDFESAPGRSSADWGMLVKDKGYDYEIHVLPHDAKQVNQETLGTFQQTFTSMGLKNIALPREDVQIRIDAARKIFPRAVFDAERCEWGLDALSLYQRQWDDELQVFRKAPKHDWTSHAADAFGYGAVYLAHRVRRRRPGSPPARDELLSDKAITRMLSGEPDGVPVQMSRVGRA